MRVYTCELAAPNANGRVNTALGTGERLFVNTCRTPRIANRTLGATMFTSTLFRVLNCRADPGCGSTEKSVVRLVVLNGTRGMYHFYRNIRDNSTISDFMSPVPSSVPNCRDRMIVTTNTFALNSSVRLSTSTPLHRPCTM